MKAIQPLTWASLLKRAKALQCAQELSTHHHLHGKAKEGFSQDYNNLLNA